MEITAPRLFETIEAIIRRIRETQIPRIEEAGQIIADHIARDGALHIFGAGHSRAFAMEMAGRAGGMACVHAIGLEEVAQNEGRKGIQINMPDLERAPETAHKILDLCHLHPQDVWIVVSNSGRNGCPVELALEIQRRGMPVIAVTSREHSAATDSRHPSAKRLFEFADVVIDNCCPYGDTLFDVPGTAAKTCASSTIAGNYIAQALNAEIVGRLVKKGVVPPIFISANVDGSDKYNEELTKRYAGRV